MTIIASDLRKLESSATKRPWKNGHDIYILNGDSIIADADEEEAYLLRMRGVGAGRTFEQQRADMDLIVTLVNHVSQFADALEFVETHSEVIVTLETMKNDLLSENAKLLEENREYKAATAAMGLDAKGDSGFLAVGKKLIDQSQRLVIAGELASDLAEFHGRSHGGHCEQCSTSQLLIRWNEGVKA